MQKLSVVIPCYNEVATLESVIQAVQQSPVSLDKEIIVVDDGSTDGTRDLLAGPLKDQISQILLHDANQGKGAALQTGFQAATGDILLIQDADLEYDPNEYSKLIQPILDQKADVVYGSRFIGGDCHRVLYFWHYMGNKFLTLLSNMLTNINLSDMETCYKVFHKDALKGIFLQEKRFGVEPEITAKIAKKHLRIYEVGISYSGRTYAEGKKINWKDGVSAIRCLLKYNLFQR